MPKKPSAHISTLGSRVTSIISVALVLLIIGILAMTFRASTALTDDIRQNIGFIVKASPDATDAEVQGLAQRFVATAWADKVTFASPEAILAEESRLMGVGIDSLLDENPFGAEYDIKVHAAWANSDSIGSIAGIVKAWPGVDEVVTEVAVIDNINSVLSRLTWILLAIGCALLVISFVLINNTVSLAVYSRRFIIHTMKLVGATGAFIRRPFLLAGMSIGLVAAVIASAVIAIARVYAARLDTIFDVLLPWSDLWIIFAGITVVGILICLAASAMATNRYLRAGYDEMFMK